MTRRGTSVAAAAFTAAALLLGALLLGARAASAEEPGVHDTAVPLAIEWVSDCDGTTRTPPACGEPPATWVEADRPVAFCTRQAGRPSWLSADDFRAIVSAAVLVWSEAEVRIGLRYDGDCPDVGTWSYTDGTNDIGWDDSRDAVRGTSLAVTVSDIQWERAVGSLTPTSRVIRTADIVLREDLRFSSPACYPTVVAHELGHALGLGHSDVRSDLMYASLVACDPVASAEDLAKLTAVYGVDRRPSAPVVSGQSSTRGVPVTLVAAATDPEGGPLTYVWEQTGGDAVIASDPAQASLTITLPPSGAVEFSVRAFDRYGHRSEETRVTLPVATATPSPTATPTATITPPPTVASLSGPIPSSGFALLVFSGGTSQQLASAAGCPFPAFWATSGGNFITFVPGASIAAVNAAWFAKFPLGIPSNTPLVARCA